MRMNEMRHFGEFINKNKNRIRSTLNTWNAKNKIYI